MKSRSAKAGIIERLGAVALVARSAADLTAFFAELAGFTSQGQIDEPAHGFAADSGAGFFRQAPTNSSFGFFFRC